MKSIFIGALLSAGLLAAQDGLSGHWTGNIDIPNQSLAVEIDLDKTAGGWVGSMGIPAQKSSGLPLDSITLAGNKFSFKVKGAPGDPTFSGTLSADGKSMSGDFSQGPGSFPFKLSKTGAAKVEMPKKSPAVAKEFLGIWEGTLEVGQSLRLSLTISNDADGAKASMVSLDQGNAQIPVGSIEQKDKKLILQIPAVGGKLESELSADRSELKGTWSQGGNDLPLTLKHKP